MALLRRTRAARARNVHYVGLVVILTLVVGILVIPSVARGWLGFAEESFAAPPEPFVIGETKHSNGIALTLQSVIASGVATDLEFSLQLPDEATSSKRASILGPIFLDQLELSGVQPLPGGIFIKLDPHQPGDTTVHFNVILGPVLDPTSPVQVGIRELSVELDNETITLDGPWEYDLPSYPFIRDQPSAMTVPQVEAIQAGVSVSVDRVESRPSGLHIYYTVHNQRQQSAIPVNNEVTLVFADGTRSQPGMMQPLKSDQASIPGGGDVAFVTVFPPLKSEISGTAASLEFGPLLVSEAMETSLVIHNPTGAWSAEDVSVNGERFTVADVSQTPDGVLAVTVTNQEPIADANVLFLAVGGANITAFDDQGRDLACIGAGTGMRRDSGGELGTGDSTILVGSVDDTVTSLTITVDQSSIMLRGPWELAVTLP